MIVICLMGLLADDMCVWELPIVLSWQSWAMKFLFWNLIDWSYLPAFFCGDEIISGHMDQSPRGNSATRICEVGWNLLRPASNFLPFIVFPPTRSNNHWRKWAVDYVGCHDDQLIWAASRYIIHKLWSIYTILIMKIHSQFLFIYGD